MISTEKNLALKTKWTFTFRLSLVINKHTETNLLMCPLYNKY